ncbi:plastid division protein PDV2 [Silene latifolia]|uniref:plastid division protein PDV2 n=1 Tax=Silene latifolia TaxID=37657 RepID=UPI003D779DF1
MDMDTERIGMVLVRASELHSKIATCIQKSTSGANISNTNGDVSNDDVNDAEQNVDDTLFTICDALDSLQSLLSSLQALQQQQQYEREAVIRDIENNRKMLLKKLSEYKGEHLDVIQEAEAFASMEVEHENEFFMPYPALAPNSVALNNGLGSRFSSARKLVQNGHDESRRSQTQNSGNKLWRGLRFLVNSTVKTTFTLFGVIAILSLAGFEPKIKKKVNTFPALTLFDPDKKTLSARCPPGKVAVMEKGEIRCIVKERVEIPFDFVATDPDVNFGCG